MPDDPMPRRESLEAPASTRLFSPEDTLVQKNPTALDEISQLAALFAAHGGGHFSAEFSANLALEIVLNEIVEQACLTTGATGAAIFLWRDEELVCRASSGTTAPGLGVRLDLASGISGDCIRSQQVQCCKAAQSDPRVDIETYCALGVHSVMLLPLLRNGRLVGILEALSSRPAALGNRDQQTLEALTYLVLKNLEQAENPLHIDPNPQPAADLSASLDKPADKPEIDKLKIVQEQSNASFPETFGDPRRQHRVDFAALFLGLIVLACSFLLGVRLAERFGWIPKVRVVRVEAKPAEAAHIARENSSSNIEERASDGSDSGASAKQVWGTPAKASSPAATSGVKPEQNGPIPGSMRVYDDGVEVFRLNPTQSNPELTPNKAGSGVQAAAEIEPERALKLSPSALHGNLIYRVEPEYPEEAREKHIQGPVVLLVHINREGVVEELELSSGDPLLGHAAIDAVKQWKFKPHIINDGPVEMETTVTLNFRLQR
jgi:TonB family protein